MTALRYLLATGSSLRDGGGTSTAPGRKNRPRSALEKSYSSFMPAKHAQPEGDFQGSYGSGGPVARFDAAGLTSTRLRAGLPGTTGSRRPDLRVGRSGPVPERQEGNAPLGSLAAAGIIFS